MAAEAPNSYKDPFWTGLASNVEQKLELPKGLLVAVLTRTLWTSTSADRALVRVAGAQAPSSPVGAAAVASEHTPPEASAPSSPAPIATAAQGAATAPPTVLKARPSRPVASSRRASTDCDPPSFVDAQGHISYKPNCLQ